MSCLWNIFRNDTERQTGINVIKVRNYVLRTISPYFRILFYGNIRIHFSFCGNMEFYNISPWKPYSQTCLRKFFLKIFVTFTANDTERQTNLKQTTIFANMFENVSLKTFVTLDKNYTERQTNLKYCVIFIKVLQQVS